MKKEKPSLEIVPFRILLKANFSQPKGTQFHSTQLCFVGSASVPKARVYFYSVFANECETIQLIYVVGVATPTYYLSMTSRPRTVIPNLFRNLYLVRSE